MNKAKKKQKPLRQSKNSNPSPIEPRRRKLNGTVATNREGLKKKNGRVRVEDEDRQEVDLYERSRWRKERRDYWRNRFRRLISNLASRSAKAKRN